jgi:hypothetical protein
MPYVTYPTLPVKILADPLAAVEGLLSDVKIGLLRTSLLLPPVIGRVKECA